MVDLTKKKVLVVGLGEVGRSLFELLKESRHFDAYGVDFDKSKIQDVGENRRGLPNKMDVIHICVPCYDQNKFSDITFDYIETFNPELAIINSTVPPGTTKLVSKRCNCLVAHSPIRGVHLNLEHMKWELQRWTKYIGGVNFKSAKAAREHFEKLGLKTRTLKSCSETELAKLLETTYRAWMIVCFQEMHRISRHFETNFDDVVDFIEDTHRLRLDRPIMFPGMIGGHCLIPNAKLLLSIYDSEFLCLILKSNKKREEEIKDKIVQEEVTKIKSRVETLQRELIKGC